MTHSFFGVTIYLSIFLKYEYVLEIFLNDILKNSFRLECEDFLHPQNYERNAKILSLNKAAHDFEHNKHVTTLNCECRQQLDGVFPIMQIIVSINCYANVIRGLYIRHFQ